MVPLEKKVECCLTHNDSHVVSGSEDGHLYFWELVEGSLVHRVPVASDKVSVVSSVSYHPKTPLLLSAAASGVISLWGPKLTVAALDQAAALKE